MSLPEPPANREEQALARHREELRQRFPMPEPAPRKPRKLQVIGALLLAAAALGYWADPAYQTEHLATAFGERKVLDLADGSHLTLDSDTRLTVDWHLRSRRVTLHQGQALFDVSHTWTRPLRVNADGVQINVLGTLFNVTDYASDVRVALLRGSVRVEAAQGSAQLAPGQQIVARQGRFSPVTSVDTEAVVAWKDNRLIFDRTPLGQALEQVQRYRRAPIRLDDPSLAALPITGVFDSSNVETLLTLLPGILPVALTKESDGTLHLKRRTQQK